MVYVTRHRYEMIKKLEEIEKEAILDALDQLQGHRLNAAKALGIAVRTLRNKLHIYRRQGESMRFIHRVIALLMLKFWTPCPCCGVHFGGHEKYAQFVALNGKSYRYACWKCHQRSIS